MAVTAREYNCPTCDLNFHVYHRIPNEINTVCAWCGGPVVFLRFPPRLYDEDGKRLEPPTETNPA